MGMFLKIEKVGLPEVLGDDGEERKKSKVMPRYFGSSTQGDSSTTY